MIFMLSAKKVKTAILALFSIWHNVCRNNEREELKIKQ
jgi:hypothetical protein